MNCPHCGKPIPRDLITSAFGSLSSEKKASSSAENGANWQRPHFAKVAYFESLQLIPTMQNNEYKRKVVLRESVLNPDYYDSISGCYIECATSLPNISSQRAKWREAMQLVDLRVFWWQGEEITGRIADNERIGREIIKSSAPKIRWLE